MRRFALSVGVLFLSGIALAQTSPLVGTWKINLSKSKYSPGPAPKEQTIKWERVQGGYRFTVDGVSGAGQPTHQATTEKDDGSDATVEGATTPTTRHLRRIDDHNYDDGDKVNGKATITRRLVISPDGRTLRVTMSGTDAQGQAVSNVVVYEKQ
jgi:hypothetical protein